MCATTSAKCICADLVFVGIATIVRVNRGRTILVLLESLRVRLTHARLAIRSNWAPLRMATPFCLQLVPLMLRESLVFSGRVRQRFAGFLLPLEIGAYDPTVDVNAIMGRSSMLGTGSVSDPERHRPERPTRCTSP